MLRLEKVTLVQGDFTLSGDIALPVGQIHAIMGPSGAGKSTLLAALAGFLQPRTGKMVWRQQDITDTPPSKRPMAMIFQDNNLFTHLTARQNVGLGIRPNLRLTEAENKAVEDALDRVGLHGLHGRRPAELSGGQQGRVAMARVMVQKRPILLLDEPFAALGPALRSEMLDAIRDLAHDMQATVLMVTHLPADARQIADTIVVVANNKIHAPVPTATLLEDPPAALKDYLGASHK